MLGSCPNKNSEEWKRLLEEANGNVDRATEMWTQEGYDKIPELNVTQEAPAETESKDKLSKLVDNIKIYLHKKAAILKQQKLSNQKEREAAYARLIENYEAAEGVDSINIFVKDAYEKAQVADRVMKRLVQNKDTYDRKEMIRELSAIADFANGYSILDEIDKKDKNEYFSGKVSEKKEDEELTPQEMLTKAINIRDAIKKQYLTEGIPLMADFLLDYKTNIDEKTLTEVNGLRDRIKNIQADSKLTDEFKNKRVGELEERISLLQNFSMDKRKMVDILEMASADESTLDYMISPLISSEDAALSLFAKAIKSSLETARLEDLQTRDSLLKEFEVYAKSTSASRDNTAKFNEGIYEELVSYYKDPKTGEQKEVKKMAFVQKYDYTKFKKAQADLYQSLGPKPEITEDSLPSEKTRLRLYKTRVAAWYSKNTEPKSKDERDAIINAKLQELENNIITEDEYKVWAESVGAIPNQYGETIYKKELSQPSKEYISSKWSAMYDKEGNPKNEKGKYHKYLTDLYFTAQEKLPASQQRGYVLPSIPKTDRERLQSQGVIKTVGTNLKEAVKIQAYDTQYGLAGLTEKGAKFLPVFYTQAMDASEVSLDLARSVLLFSSMANKYEAMNDVNSEISLFKTIIGERQIAETNSKGQPIIDAFAKKLGYTEYIRQNGESNSKKHVDAFVDMVVYGEMQKAEELLGFSFSKLTNTLSAYSAVTTIAADVLKGVANNLQGNIQLIIEANSGEFFSKKNLKTGKTFYTKSIPTILADFGKSTTDSLVGKLVERYDAMQGNFKDNYGNNVTGSAAMRLFRTDTLFFNQHFGEHEIQTSTMFALMDATKVIDKATGNEITLLQAHEQYGATEVEKNTDFTEAKRQDFQNRLHALNKRMHGVYNDFDKGTAQRYSLGRLAVMYRKHLVPGYKRRFKKLSMDEELGSFTEGYYRTFWDTFLKDLVTFKWNTIQGWSTYTPFQKAQTKRVIAEATIILTTAALIAVLRAMADDDDELKKNYAYNFVLYEMVRMRSETSSYISPMDAYRVVKSPSAMTSTLERAIKFTDQFFLTWDPTKLEYQRKQGVWNKGDNKSWAYFLKLMGYSGYNITPEVAVEAFEGTLKK
jgi:hypothetical protein